MSARDDLARATEEARAQVREARAGVAASRQTRSGGAAKNARQAEQQLHALRAAIADDVRDLKGRVTGADTTTRRRAATMALAGGAALSAVIGTGLAARSAMSGRVTRRSMQRQASALAAALAEQAARATSSAVVGDAARAGGRRRGRGALVALVAAGAAVGATALVRQRQQAPIDPDDLWLPERTTGPA
jgi:hypothetical protein